jgi:hypothetical protein
MDTLDPRLNKKDPRRWSTNAAWGLYPQTPASLASAACAGGSESREFAVDRDSFVMDSGVPSVRGSSEVSLLVSQRFDGV